MQCIPLFHDLTLYMNSSPNQASLTDTISHKLTNCNLCLCPSWVFGNMVRGTNARGRGRGRTSRQAERPVRYRDAEAEVEVPTQPTARDPSPEPTTPTMEATLGAIMSRLDDMQRQINEKTSHPWPQAHHGPGSVKQGDPLPQSQGPAIRKSTT